VFAAAAPKQATPLLSAEYLAEREINRTGTAPEALLSKSPSTNKLSRTPSSSSKKSTSTANSKPTKAAIVTASPASPPRNTAPNVPAAVGSPGSDSLSESELSSSSGKDAESLVVLQPDDAKAAAAGGAKGLALPFKPMSVAFKNICYYVDAPGVSKHCCFAGSYSGCCLQHGIALRLPQSCRLPQPT
jgi:hypothetical protein